HGAGGGRDGLVDALRQDGRPHPLPLPGSARPRHPVAGDPGDGDVRPPHRGRVGVGAAGRAPPVRRVAGDPARAVRGRARGRSLRPPAVPAHHPASDRRHDPGRRRAPGDGRVPGARQGVRHDGRWSRLVDAVCQHVRVQAGVPVLRTRVRVGGDLRGARVARGCLCDVPPELWPGAQTRRLAMSATRTRWRHLAGIALVLAWTLPPFLYLVMLSIKPERILIERSQVFFWPTLERYRDFVASGLGLPIWNSLVTSTLGSVGTLVLGGLAALTFSFLEFRGKTLLFLLILLPRMFPPVTTLIPIQLMLKTLGLIDTRLALIILFTGFEIPLAIWVMRTFLDEIPRELTESAALDGASLPAIIARIILPLSGPGLLAAFILSFI